MTKKTSEIRARLENIAPIWRNLKELVSKIDKAPENERRDIVRFVVEGGFQRADGTRPVCRIRPSHRILLLAGSPCAVRSMTFSEALSALRTGCVESNALAAANERLLERTFAAFRPKSPSQREAFMKIPESLFASVNFAGVTARFPSFKNKLFEAAMLDERGAFASMFARVFSTSNMRDAAKRMVDTLLFHCKNKSLSDDCVWSAHWNATKFLERLLRATYFFRGIGEGDSLRPGRSRTEKNSGYSPGARRKRPNFGFPKRRSRWTEKQSFRRTHPRRSARSPLLFSSRKTRKRRVLESL